MPKSLESLKDSLIWFTSLFDHKRPIELPRGIGPYYDLPVYLRVSMALLKRKQELLDSIEISEGSFEDGPRKASLLSELRSDLQLITEELRRRGYD